MFAVFLPEPYDHSPAPPVTGWIRAGPGGRLPATLDRIGGGASVPVTYGTNSAQVTNDVVVQQFNPAAGLADFGPIGTPGTFTVTLGYNGEPSTPNDFVTVSVANAEVGTYQGTITLTVAVL